MVRSGLMDTRTKIVDAKWRPPPGETAWAAATGWFDVLTADHCRLLAAARQSATRLAVVVYEDEEGRTTALNATARAQLAAALEAVDRVVICRRTAAARWLDSRGLLQVIDLEAGVRRDVVADVLKLHAAAANA